MLDLMSLKTNLNHEISFYTYIIHSLHNDRNCIKRIKPRIMITLESIGKLKSLDELMGISVYAVVNRGTYGFRVYVGAITGIRFTKSKPEFYIVNTKEELWVKDITTERSEVLEMIEVPDSIDRYSQIMRGHILFPTDEDKK